MTNDEIVNRALAVLAGFGLIWLKDQIVEAMKLWRKHQIKRRHERNLRKFLSELEEQQEKIKRAWESRSTTS